MYLLWSMLTETHVDLAHYFFRQCQAITTVMTDIICIGGMLTPIITHFLGDRAVDLTVAPCNRYLNLDHLVCLTIIKSRDPLYLLKQRLGPKFPLPNPSLTEVTDFYDCMNKKMILAAHIHAVSLVARSSHHPLR